MLKINKNPKNIFFTGCLHIGHRNIIKSLSSWPEGGMRDFKSIEEMNESIYSGINSNVGKDDLLICLGDTMFGKKDYGDFASKLVCQNIWLMPGNHCNRDNLSRENGFTLLPDYCEISVQKQPIVLCHYPILSFNYMYRGGIHLFSHVHSAIQQSEKPAAKYFNTLKTLDVGIDNAKYLLGEYRPFNLANDVEKIMKDRISKSEVDHH